jgi:hypothetical protein
MIRAILHSGGDAMLTVQSLHRCLSKHCHLDAAQPLVIACVMELYHYEGADLLMNSQTLALSGRVLLLCLVNFVLNSFDLILQIRNLLVELIDICKQSIISVVRRLEHLDKFVDILQHNERDFSAISV